MPTIATIHTHCTQITTHNWLYYFGYCLPITPSPPTAYFSLLTTCFPVFLCVSSSQLVRKRSEARFITELLGDVLSPLALLPTGLLSGVAANTGQPSLFAGPRRRLASQASPASKRDGSHGTHTHDVCKISCSEKFFNQMSKPPATLFEGDVQGCHRFVSWVTPAIQFQRPPFTCALHVVYIQLVKRDPSHFGVHGGLIPVKKPTGNLHDQTLSKLPTYCLGDPRQFWHWLPRPSWASASGRLRALFMRALRITCDLVLGGSTANVKQHLLDLS